MWMWDCSGRGEEHQLREGGRDGSVDIHDKIIYCDGGL